jgi:hypothetical protein
MTPAVQSQCLEALAESASELTLTVLGGLGQLLKELNARALSVRFGFVTTEGTPDMRAMADEAGALFLSAKPFTPEQFESALRPLFS